MEGREFACIPSTSVDSAPASMLQAIGTEKGNGKTVSPKTLPLEICQGSSWKDWRIDSMPSAKFKDDSWSESNWK